MQLHVQAVLQAQRLELILGNRALQSPNDLPAKLGRAFGDDALTIAFDETVGFFRVVGIGLSVGRA